MLRRLVLFLTVAAPAVGFDQLSKAWARGALAAGPMPVLDDNVILRLGFNPGIAFSLFPSGGRWLLAALAFAAAIAIAVHVARRPTGRLAWVALALIAAGALGNAIDRIHAGAVTDFVVVRVAGHAWPTFNVADAALVLGAVALLLGPRPRPRAPSA